VHPDGPPEIEAGDKTMISRRRVERLYLGMSHNKAMALLKAVARAHGFEITEALDFEAFVRQRMGAGLNRKTTLVQMQKPAMMLGSALLDDTLPLLLPLRMILREVSDDACILHFPGWDVARDPENTQAQHCMDIVYTEAAGKVALTLRESQGKRHSLRSTQ
jgi:hypothetical protein